MSLFSFKNWQNSGGSNFISARQRKQNHGKSSKLGGRRLNFEPLEHRALLSVCLWTDKIDYAPGETAVLSASGFTAGETVELQVVHDVSTPGLPNGAGHDPWQLIDGGAGDLDGAADGNLQTSWFVNPDDSVGCKFNATATGLTSNETATTTFTDNFQGAVFTTLADGSTVNSNIYGSKDDVYVNGGPDKNGPQLTDGFYFFQVTTPASLNSPNGVLLSSDNASERLVSASGGHLTQYHGTTHATVQDTDDLGNIFIRVQIIPFDDTTNDGGEYKVDLIYAGTSLAGALGMIDNADGGDPRFVNFSQSGAKSDNFKVEDPYEGYPISGTKFEDHNGNGIRDLPDDQGLAGWTIFVDVNNNGKNDDGLSDVTEPDGTYRIDNVPEGTYHVLEEIKPGWTPTLSPGLVTVPPAATGVDFGNFQNVTVSGKIYEDVFGNDAQNGIEPYDSNASTGDDVLLGESDPHYADLKNDYPDDPNYDPGTGGVLITLQNDKTTLYTQSNKDGNYSFNDVGPGSYSANEGLAVDNSSPLAGIQSLSGSGSITMSADGKSIDTVVVSSGTLTATSLVTGTLTIGSSTPVADAVVNAPVSPTTITIKIAPVTPPSPIGPGTWTLGETVPKGWTQTYQTADEIIVGGNDEKSILSGGESKSNDFANFKNVEISGTKFYDASLDGEQGLYDSDGDGIPDKPEPDIEGVTIQLLKDGTLIAERTTTKITTDDGSYYYNYKFSDLNGDDYSDLGPGNYTVKEVLPSDDWHHITNDAVPGNYSIQVGLDENGVRSGGDGEWDDIPPIITPVNHSNLNNDFGNVEFGPGGGHTIGFWTNKNGYAILSDGGDGGADELTMLDELNLACQNGGCFDPTTYTALRNWLLSAKSTNMAYMLSAQLTAMELNVEAGDDHFGFVQDGYVYAADIALASHLNDYDFANLGHNLINDQGFVLLSDLLKEADAVLGAEGGNLTLADSPLRTYEESLKNLLDALNNNQSIYVLPPVIKV